MIDRRGFLVAASVFALGGIARAGGELDLVVAARSQVGVTVSYDPAYVAIPYPMGDVDRATGVCTDVIVRAYRDAFGLDLQRLIHEDMRANFSRYPSTWGLTRPDKNIDHRRVGNQAAFFARHGGELDLPDQPAAYRPGDLVTQTVPPNLPHIVIVSDRVSADGTPLVIHNIGQGTQEEDRLFVYARKRRFRFGVG